MPSRRLVLASTSPYRRALLERLRLPFEIAKPDVDESPLPGEAPAELALRLSEAKAREPAAAYPDSLLIGSDQVAVLDGALLSKPLTHDNAVRQLRAMRGRTVEFLTGVAVHDTRTDRTLSRLVRYEVRLRNYTDDTIE